MKCIYLLCSESVSVDSATNRVSVFHLLDEVNLIQCPGVLPVMAISSLLEREEGDDESTQITTDISFSGVNIVSVVGQIGFHAHNRARNITFVNGLYVAYPGEYTVSITHNEQKIGSWRFAVRTPGVEAKTFSFQSSAEVRSEK